MIRAVTLSAVATLTLGCQIPYTNPCDPKEPAYAPDAGTLPNPGDNGLPRQCQPLGGRCDPNRCVPRERLTPAPDCMCVPEHVPDAGEPA